MVRESLALALLLGCSGFAPTLAQTQPFVAPAINPGVFREDAVSRVRGQNGTWFYVCDIIVAMNRRFCSLSVAGISAADRQETKLTVSTTESGQPGAILYLPHGIDMSKPVFFEIAGKQTKSQSKSQTKENTKKQGAGKKLRLLVCGNNGCQTVFPLTGVDVANLRNGGLIQVRYTKLLSFFLPNQMNNPSEEVTIPIKNAGFVEALNATMSQ